MPMHAVVLAAGKGTRMKSDLAKVLHEAAGRTLIDWSLSALGDLPLQSIAVVVGHQAPNVAAAIADHDLAPLVATALQAEQLGTGHATAIGLAALLVAQGDTVLVMPGDMPLLTRATLQGLVSRHRESGNVATVATAILDDPDGYGRIVRRDDQITGIVEQPDATEEQRAIAEVNTSVYVFDAVRLAEMLGLLDNENAQGELYLTDVVGMLAGAGTAIGAFVVPATEACGVNTPEQLAAAAASLQGRLEA